MQLVKIVGTVWNIWKLWVIIGDKLEVQCLDFVFLGMIFHNQAFHVGNLIENNPFKNQFLYEDLPYVLLYVESHIGKVENEMGI